MFGALDAAGSGLAANQLWLDLVSQNLANANDVAARGTRPYRALEPVLQPTYGADGLPDGVTATALVQSRAPAEAVYAPGVPGANAQGYVAGSNVDLALQMADLMAASRAYQANAAAFQAVKADEQAALQV